MWITDTKYEDYIVVSAYKYLCESLIIVIKKDQILFKVLFHIASENIY